MSEEVKTICVVGAGAAGLASIKSCLEEGLQVVCFEKTDDIAGLWHYRHQLYEGVGRVMKTTITNTSKEINGFSDHPYPKEFPNYMDIKKVCQYFDSYAERFDLRKHIQFKHSVIKVEKNYDYEQTQRLKVVYKNDTNGSVDSRIFDGVMVCTGHHTSPKIPEFPGQRNYRGKIIHTRDMPSLSGLVEYKDKNVVVVGMANSGCDAAVELSNICDKTFIAKRTGAWIFNRVGTSGLPMDYSMQRRYIWVINHMLPFWLTCWFFETFYFNNNFNHKLYGIQPKNRCFAEQPVINDMLASKILSGKIIPKRNIEKFTENGVIFQGDRSETKCDLVVMATGYHLGFPLIDKDLFDSSDLSDKPLELYKQVFPGQLSHPSLAIIGVVQPNGGIYPLFEMQARWFAALMTGQCQLPSREQMLADIDKVNYFRQKRYNDSPRNMICVDWIQYMDEIAQQIGVKPDIKSYLWSDFALFRKLVFGAALPYQYRLVGRHRWSGARDAIMQSEYRVKYALNPNEANITTVFTKNLYTVLFSFLIFLFAYIVFEIFD